MFAEQEAAFSQMEQLFEQLKAALPHQQIDTLSMGMTDDMQSAIQMRLNDGAYWHSHFWGERLFEKIMNRK